jgi:biopolymer transport protein ExbD
MSFAFASPRSRRRPSLTPMIDVVFLLLVFFMLAARFGQDGAIVLSAGGSEAATEWTGPPRLIDIAPDALRLNGAAIDMQALEQALIRLSETKSDPILLRPQGGADLQRLLDVMAVLNAAGFTGLSLVAP